MGRLGGEARSRLENESVESNAGTDIAAPKAPGVALPEDAAVIHAAESQHRPDLHIPDRDLSRPRWANWVIVGGVALFWAGFILWLLK